MVAGLINLTFHGLGSPPHAIEESERAVWVSGQRFREILDAVRADDAVRITFDDGNASDHAVALPALVERRLSATFFVLGARIGAPGYLDRVQLGELASAGMRIGVHGMDHRKWRHLSAADTEREMSESRHLIEDAIGREVAEASCPFGAYDRRVLRELRARRYERVFTSDRLPADAGAWFQPRYTVHANDDAPAVRRWLAAASASAGLLLQRLKVFWKQNRI